MEYKNIEGYLRNIEKIEITFAEDQRYYVVVQLSCSPTFLRFSCIDNYELIELVKQLVKFEEIREDIIK